MADFIILLIAILFAIALIACYITLEFIGKNDEKEN